MICSIKFGQDESPATYSIEALGVYIRIRAEIETDTGHEVEVIDVPTDIIYFNEFKRDRFLSEKDIRARKEANVFIIEAHDDHSLLGLKKISIPLDLWLTYVTLATKADERYHTEGQG
jgi:hypothetical protein